MLDAPAALPISLHEENRLTAFSAAHGQVQASASAGNSDARAAPPLYLLTPAQCAIAPRREYIIKGLLARGDHSALVGLPGTAKSCLAPYIGYRTALGLDVFGHRTKAVPVLYLAAEDGTGMTMRVRALHDRMGDAPNFLLQPVPIDLLTGNSHVEAVEDLIRKRQPGFIILDTISRAFPGLKENDPDGMGQVVKVVRGLIAVCNSAVISVHHTPKDTVTPRGHSVLNGDLDATLFIEGTGSDVRNVTMGKNRNGPSDKTFSFTVAVHDFGPDEDGDPVTAPVAEPGERGAAARPRLTASERKARDFLADLLCVQGEPMPQTLGFPADLKGIDETVWNATCEARRLSTAETLEDRKRVFRRVYSNLMTKRVVGACDGWVWLAEPGERAGQTDRAKTLSLSVRPHRGTETDKSGFVRFCPPSCKTRLLTP